LTVEALPEAEFASLPTSGSVSFSEQADNGEQDSGEQGAKRWRGRRRRRGGRGAADKHESQTVTGAPSTAYVEEIAETEQEVAPQIYAGVGGVPADRSSSPGWSTEPAHRSERAPASSPVPFVMPGESLSKYGGAPAEDAHQHAAAPAAPAAPRSTFKPPTLIESPIQWDGSGLLPGESLSRHRNRPVEPAVQQEAEPAAEAQSDPRSAVPDALEASDFAPDAIEEQEFFAETAEAEPQQPAPEAVQEPAVNSTEDELIPELAEDHLVEEERERERREREEDPAQAHHRDREQRAHHCGDARAEAIALFKHGASPEFQLKPQISLFLQQITFQPELKQTLLEYLLTFALVDGELHVAERDILQRVATYLGFDSRQFLQLLDMLQAQQRFHQQGGGYYSRNEPGRATDELADAYRALGVAASATDSEVKTAYRRLMSQHHPDKLVAKGLPEEMLKLATEIKRIEGWVEGEKYARDDPKLPELLAALDRHRTAAEGARGESTRMDRAEAQIWAVLSDRLHERARSIEAAPIAAEERIARLLALGAREASSPREVARSSDIVVTCVTDSPQVTEVTGQPLSGNAHLFQMTAATAAIIMEASGPFASTAPLA